MKKFILIILVIPTIAQAFDWTKTFTCKSRGRELPTLYTIHESVTGNNLERKIDDRDIDLKRTLSFDVTCEPDGEEIYCKLWSKHRISFNPTTGKGKRTIIVPPGPGIHNSIQCNQNQITSAGGGKTRQ